MEHESGLYGFDFTLDSGEIVGYCENFDQPLRDALHVVLSILRAPRCLADELEAAGSICLDRSGAILDARVTAGIQPTAP